MIGHFFKSMMLKKYLALKINITWEKLEIKVEEECSLKIKVQRLFFRIFKEIFSHMLMNLSIISLGTILISS